MLKGKSTKKVQGQKRSGEGQEEEVKKKPRRHLDNILTKAMGTKNQYFLVTGAVGSLQKKVASHEAPPQYNLHVYIYRVYDT
jgi:hypothetical protein